MTDGRGIRTALATQRAEDSSESREEEPVVSRAVGSHTVTRTRPEATMCRSRGWGVQPLTCPGPGDADAARRVARGLLVCVWLGCDGFRASWLDVEGRVTGTSLCGWLCHALRLSPCVCVCVCVCVCLCVCDFFLPLHFSAVTLVPFLSRSLKVRTQACCFLGGLEDPWYSTSPVKCRRGGRR